eukprot:GHVS01033025.1.p1 GENE.GHVS01033025.1~~GHVS01033025.1.p1  ORF type:complete len:488 (+),score=55.24 GHVS01033025.1:177-1640(+)
MPWSSSRTLTMTCWLPSSSSPSAWGGVVPLRDVRRTREGRRGGTRIEEIEKRIRHKDNEVEIAINEVDFVDKKYHIENATVAGRYPTAVIGQNTYRVKNSYDQEVAVRVAVQVGHLQPLMQMVRNYTCWVPVDGLQLHHADKFRLILNTSRSGGHFFSYCVERVVLLALIVFVTSFGEASGIVSKLVFCLASLGMAASFVPSAIATGTLLWQRLMEDEFQAQGTSKASTVDAPLASETNQRFDYLRRARDRRELNWVMRFYRQHVVRAIQMLVNMKMRKTRLWSILTEMLVGPVATELAKCIIVISLLGCNQQLGSSSGGKVAVMLAALVTVAMVLINCTSILRAISQWTRFASKLLVALTVCLHFCIDLVSNSMHYVMLIVFYCRVGALWAVSKATFNGVCKPPASFRFPNKKPPFAPHRYSEVDSIDLVVPELGMLLPGKLETDCRSQCTAMAQLEPFAIWTVSCQWRCTLGISSEGISPGLTWS